MNKVYSDGTTITAILEVDPVPSYTFSPDASKLRYKEPYVSEAQNLKDSGIIPVGIYNGFTPSAPGGDDLLLEVDGTRGDSVAVIETRTGRYNLTVRSDADILVEDFSGVSFPALVVLRTVYSIGNSGLSGLTSSKILVVDPTLDDSQATHLNTGDVRICRVTGDVAGVVVFTTADRDTASLASLGTKYASTILNSGTKFINSATPDTFINITPSLGITLTPAQTQQVLVTFTGTAAPFASHASCLWRLEVTKTNAPAVVTDYYGGTAYDISVGASGGIPVAFQWLVNVTAGLTYRFEIQIKRLDHHADFAGIYISAANPASLVVAYK